MSLVISRYEGESVELWVPGQRPVEIAVEKVREGKTRLSIEADRSWAVHRYEVVEAILERKGKDHPDVTRIYNEIREGRYVPTAEDMDRLGLYDILLGREFVKRAVVA